MAITRAVIVVHGAGRDADNYYRSALAGAFLAGALQTALVISPRMASNAGGCRDSLAQNEISWDCNTWRSGGPSLSHPAVTSFDFLDEILRKLARRDVFPNLRGIVVTGHSAGGQVTNRYGMSSKVHDDARRAGAVRGGEPVELRLAHRRAAHRPGRLAAPGGSAGVRARDGARRAGVPVPAGRARLHHLRPVALRVQEPHRVRRRAQRLAADAAARLAPLHLPPRRGRHPAAQRLRRLVRGDGAGPHPAGARTGVREVRQRAARRAPHGGRRHRVRPQRALHLHLGALAAHRLPAARQLSGGVVGRAGGPSVATETSNGTRLPT